MDQNLIVTVLRLIFPALNSYLKNKGGKKDKEEDYIRMIGYFQEIDQSFSRLFLFEFKEYEFKKLTGHHLPANRIDGFIRFKTEHHLSWKEAGRLRYLLNWQDEQNPFLEITSSRRKFQLVINICWLSFLGIGLGYFWWAEKVMKANILSSHIGGCIYLITGLVVIIFSHVIYKHCVIPYDRVRWLIKKRDQLQG